MTSAKNERVDYFETRPHLATVIMAGSGAVVCRERLGGLLSFYYRAVHRHARIE
jgi:hypothetical protein